MTTFRTYLVRFADGRGKFGYTRSRLKDRVRDAALKHPRVAYECQNWIFETESNAKGWEIEISRILKARGVKICMPHHKPGKDNEGEWGDWFQIQPWLDDVVEELVSLFKAVEIRPPLIG